MGSPVLAWESGLERREHLRRYLVSLVRPVDGFASKLSISKEIDAVLPWRGLPLGCVHELQSASPAGAIAMAALLSARAPAPDRQTIYVSARRGLHAAGLASLGLRPETWIHVSARRTEDCAWATLEALRCPRVGVVLSELNRADLTMARRLQLAAEEHGTTCFLLGDTRTAIAAVITRWRIASIVAPADARFTEPCWDLDLTYCRGGHPAHWSVVWRNAQLEPLEPERRQIDTCEPFVFTARFAG